VARSSDEEASGPCDSEHISNSSLSVDGCDVQGEAVHLLNRLCHVPC
jgi:hypothetical protein